ncbi:MAG: RHS repeat protein [Dehalococcoidia bacterium]|uniref:RHS repeat domain-containing protein n=1 Tax=Candidatus Amarobacter glycogenicus TaxID=3140699 RepID=UPI003134E7C1|nr:RHS repeat protein [Dehalococcoidia bacterium]
MTHGYDNANRLTTVTDWNSNSTTYSYDDAGRMTSTTLPSGTGIVSTNTYDNANRLTGITHVKNGSTTVASVAYTLDDVGNRTQRVDQQGTHAYAYDDLYRLTSVTHPGPATTTYDFDAFGNRTEMVVGAASTTSDYDDADRLTEVTPPSPASPISYTWDDNGDLTARGSDSFFWDYEDRMVSATVNSVTTSFVYRGDGLRDSRAVSGGATTQFTWDVAGGLPVVLDDGNQYVYGAGLTAMKQSGSWYYYLADGLGSTMAIVDSSGNSQKSYTYDVYGEATPSGGPANEFDFAGQQTDGTGLQYLRARYYDPVSGTFLSRDPLASRPSWTTSVSAYAGANPTNFSDPSGLCRVDRHLPCLFPDSSGDIDAFLPDVAGAATTVASALQDVNEWLFNLSSGDLHDFMSNAAAALALVGEYLAKVGEGCAARPIDCYFALEHIAIGVAMIELAVAGTAATCAVSSGLACWFAGLVFMPVGITGLAVVGIGLDELRHLKELQEGAHGTGGTGGSH